MLRKNALPVSGSIEATSKGTWLYGSWLCIDDESCSLIVDTRDVDNRDIDTREKIELGY